MTIYDVIEPNVKYLVLSIDFEHSEHASEIKSNTSLSEKDGFSCCWRIAENRKFSKIVIYLKNNKDIYIGDFTHKEKKDSKYKVCFTNTKKIGNTKLSWHDFVNNGVQMQNAMRYIEIEDPVIFPDEIEDKDLFEGSKKQITVNAYERSSQARQDCINEYGYKCVICNFDFEKMYGEIGHNFIHVHHVKPLSEIDEQYKINPIEDLRPVCPNCHAMLHKRKPAYSIEEIQDKIEQTTYNKSLERNI